MERNERLEQIQVLRGVAALGVFIFHLGVTLDRFTPVDVQPLVHWASAGVDLFFVISGFVMAWSVRDLSGPTAAGSFLGRRFWRIAPLLYILTLERLWIDTTVGGATFDVARIVNCFAILPVMRSPHDFQYALVQAWTLGYEFAFYLLVALVVALGVRWRLTLLAGLVAVLTFVPVQPFSDTLMIEFAFGLGAYGLWTHRLVTPRLAIAALPLAVLFYALPLGEARFLKWGVPAAFLFVAVLGWRPKGMAAAIGGWLGMISYSMYLSHQATFNLLKPLVPNLPLEVALAMMAVTGIIVSWLIYTAIEAPLQRVKPGLLRLLPFARTGRKNRLGGETPEGV